MLLIELARGRAPYANFSLTNIIMMTLHSDPPELDSDCHCEVSGLCIAGAQAVQCMLASLLEHEPFEGGGSRPGKSPAAALTHRSFLSCRWAHSLKIIPCNAYSP